MRKLKNFTAKSKAVELIGPAALEKLEAQGIRLVWDSEYNLMVFAAMNQGNEKEINIFHRILEREAKD